MSTRQKKLFFMILSISIFIASCSNGDMATIEGTGTIEAVQVDVSVGIAGKINKIYIEEGDKVNAGDILLKINDTDFRIQYKLAKARLDGASASLKLLLAGTREEDVQQAQEKVKAAKAAFEKAQANYDRIKNLFESGSATKSLFDEAKAGHDMEKQIIRHLRKCWKNW